MTATDDPAARMRAAKHLSTSTFGGSTIGPVLVVSEADRDAVLDELERLRSATVPRGFLAQAYAAGWHDAIAAYRTPGWAEREEGWRKYLAEVNVFVASKQAAPQQPEPTGCAS